MPDEAEPGEDNGSPGGALCSTEVRGGRIFDWLCALVVIGVRDLPFIGVIDFVSLS